MLDAQTLLADWAALRLGIGNMYGIGKNPLHGSFEISHATDQLIDAGSPYFAAADNATDSGTTLLRVGLGIRLRFGFGLLGILGKESRAVLPLNLSTVIAAVKARDAGITLLVPLKHIERPYGRSNIYVHIGLKHHTWSPIFASQYLGPAVLARRHPFERFKLLRRNPD